MPYNRGRTTRPQTRTTRADAEQIVYDMMDLREDIHCRYIMATDSQPDLKQFEDFCALIEEQRSTVGIRICEEPDGALRHVFTTLFAFLVETIPADFEML
ncbi:hypothetical protein N7491_009936 [Penicillium cf. griseofulvum]|uniref:Uncharacterized protein n=1 Tax=Penicillium cf. griseofulvum TaxID=2972120 RepID=A0A9W9T5L5_9EURO|nr:hypothetical protein N7472_000265 [Penicillium cf. griseofulvum]KAJ5421491.1 hypothetical protein N7491_009936 [Penicillium cf. griseofulvum]